MDLFDQISNFASSTFDSVGDFFGGGDDDLEVFGLAESGYNPQTDQFIASSTSDENFLSYDPYNIEQYGLAPSDDESSMYQLQAGLSQYPEDTTIAQDIKGGLFDFLGVGPETAKAISAFASAANRGGGRQAQAQGRGRVGPGLPTSARAPTSQAGRTSRARQAASGERAVQAAISQSNRAQSAARAIANQMARAGTITSTNDLADMISGATSPKGTKQALPGTRLRQLAIPRTA